MLHVLLFLGERFFCSNCDKHYKLRRDLYRHQTYECGTKGTWKCPYCPRMVKQKYDLKRHVDRLHQSEKANFETVYRRLRRTVDKRQIGESWWSILFKIFVYTLLYYRNFYLRYSFHGFWCSREIINTKINQKQRCYSKLKIFVTVTRKFKCSLHQYFKCHSRSLCDKRPHKTFSNIANK